MSGYAITFEFVPSVHIAFSGQYVDYPALVDPDAEKGTLSEVGLAFVHIAAGVLDFDTRAVLVREHRGLYAGVVNPAFTILVDGVSEERARALALALTYVFAQDSVLVLGQDQDCLDCRAHGVSVRGVEHSALAASGILTGAILTDEDDALALLLGGEDRDTVRRALLARFPHATVTPVGGQVAVIGHDWRGGDDGDSLAIQASQGAVNPEALDRLRQLAREWRAVLAVWAECLPLTREVPQ